jgi:hypothetical protein
VSQEDFDRIEQSCYLVGARNISEFMRMAVTRLMSGDDPSLRIKQNLELMNDFISKLDSAVDRIVRVSSAWAPEHVGQNDAAVGACE